MKVRLKGKDGGDVVCRINSKNYDPERMEIAGNDKVQEGKLNLT